MIPHQNILCARLTFYRAVDKTRRDLVACRLAATDKLRPARLQWLERGATAAGRAGRSERDSAAPQPTCPDTALLAHLIRRAPLT